MCKERCLAAWGESPNLEFTGEIKPLLGWIQAPTENWAAVLLSISLLGYAGLTL